MSLSSYLNSFRRYWRYYWPAKTRYQVHSPFVFDFVEQVLEDDRHFYAFDHLNNLQSRLEQDERSLNVTDLGAGSKQLKSNERQVREIAKTALSSPFYNRLLYRMVQYYRPETLIELGTSLGLSSLYMAKGNPKARLYTVEGCPQTAAIAFEQFQRLKAENIEPIVGNFDAVLPELINGLQQIDFVFFDGNHRKEPTLRYFEQCLALAHADSIFVFDDIHWSKEMEAAWEAIKAHPKVRLSIDLFEVGIVFFRNEQREREHFRLIRACKKPFAIGLW